MEKKIYGYTRCPLCFIRLGYTNDFPPKPKYKDDQPPQWQDPDWVIQHHLKTCPLKKK